MIKKVENIHTIISFLCMPCCSQQRFEIGLMEHLAYQIPNSTFEEVEDEFPEIILKIEMDEFQRNIFHQFIHCHGQHDIRFFRTYVPEMKNIFQKRTCHHKKIIHAYEQYQEVSRQTSDIIKQSNKANTPKKFPSHYANRRIKSRKSEADSKK